MISCRKKVMINCSVEKLWEAVTNLNDSSWRSDLSQIVIMDEYHFIEYTKNNFTTHFTITSKKMFEEYRFVLENLNMRGQWYASFKKLSESCCEMDFTEELEVNKPIMKLLAKPYLKSQQKKYLRDLIKFCTKK